MAATTFSEAQLPVLKIKPIRREYTLEEYLRFEARSKDKHEFIDKQIIKMPNAKGPHNIIAFNTGFSLKKRVEVLPKKYIFFTSDQKIYLPSMDEGLYADVLAVSEHPLYWDDDKLLLINPLLIVEVLSRSTKKYDRGDKFHKYRTLESFREYVLIDQFSYHVETWFREEPGLWRENVVTDPAAEIQIRSMGVSLKLSEIYENIVFE